MIKFICLFLSLFFMSSLHAWKLDNVFSGMSSNITSPHSYQDQAAGYYTGGGYAMRTRRGSFQPVSLTPPILKTGCGGLDMYMGSFSFISSPQLVAMAKNLGAQAASYGFHLALKTYAPQIETLLKDLRNLSVSMNQFGVNDCHVVEAFYASAVSKNSALYETVCKDLKGQGGDDYLRARENCANGERAREAARQLQAQSKEAVLLDNFNLFIVAARKAGVPNDMLVDTMAIAGTLVVKNGEPRFWDSLILEDDTFNAHLKGGSASIYQCRGAPCVDMVKLDNQEISIESSYQGKAHAKLREIKAKMLDDVAFIEAEIDFLSSLGETFPIYNYLSLEAVTGLSIMDKSSDLAAGYMLLHYLGKIINEIRVAAQALEGRQYKSEDFRTYLNRLDRVQDFLNLKYQDLMERAYRAEKRAQYIEKHHMAKIR